MGDYMQAFIENCNVDRLNTNMMVETGWRSFSKFLLKMLFPNVSLQWNVKQGLVISE